MPDANAHARGLAQEAPTATEVRLRHLVEHAQDLIYDCDPGGRFTYVNPAAARVMQYEPHELIGVHFLQLIRPDYHEAAGERYSRQLQQRIPNTYFEFPAVTKSRDIVWIGQHVQLVQENGAIVGVQAIARDITRQKAAEERLRQSEAKYRSLIQGAAYGIYRATPDGRILDANPAFAHMLGYDSVDEVLRLNMRDVYRSAADRQRLIERFRDGEGSSEIEWKRKDGSTITVWLTARVVDLGADGDRAYEGVVEDITAKRALEEQLREAQNIEAIGLLARGVAHDFNNVLAAIMGYANLLELHLEPGDAAREDAEAIGKAAERGAALTRQLLAFSERQRSEVQMLDLNAILLGCDNILGRVAGGGIALRIHAADSPLRVRAERGQIEQALMNLVVNARNAMPHGGEIDITLRAVDLDAHAVTAYPGLPPGRYGRLSVHDTGVGVVAAVKPTTFEPFFSKKSSFKGAGLGLAIVYGIVSAARGTLTFGTTPGGGTTFDVLLPLAETFDPTAPVVPT